MKREKFIKSSLQINTWLFMRKQRMMRSMISQPSLLPQITHTLDHIFHPQMQASLTSMRNSPIKNDPLFKEDQVSTIETIEIGPSQTFKINRGLNEQHKEQLIKVLQKHNDSFSWDYSNMKGIHLEFFTHHIYIYISGRMQTHLRTIVLNELDTRRYNKGRTIEIACVRFYLPNLWYSMCLPSCHCTQEKW